MHSHSLARSLACSVVVLSSTILPPQMARRAAHDTAVMMRLHYVNSLSVENIKHTVHRAVVCCVLWFVLMSPRVCFAACVVVVFTGWLNAC